MSGEIQHINEIIPPGVQIQRMLVGREGLRVVAIVLVDGSHLKRTIAKGGEAGLDGEHPGLWRKCPLIERYVKIERAKGEKNRNRLDG